MCTIRLSTNKHVRTQCNRHTSLSQAGALQPKQDMRVSSGHPTPLLHPAGGCLLSASRPEQQDSVQNVPAVLLLSAETSASNRHSVPKQEMAARRAAQVLSSENTSQYARSKDLMRPSHNKTYLQEGYFNINMLYLDTLSRAQSQIYHGKQRDHQL